MSFNKNKNTWKINIQKKVNSKKKLKSKYDQNDSLFYPVWVTKLKYFSHLNYFNFY